MHENRIFFRTFHPKHPKLANIHPVHNKSKQFWVPRDRDQHPIGHTDKKVICADTRGKSWSAWHRQPPQGAALVTGKN